MKLMPFLSCMFIFTLCASVYSMPPKQAAMLSAFGGWGDVGKLSIVEEPVNGGEYSLKVHWSNRPEYMNTSPYWVLSWPVSAKGYDTVSFYLLVERKNDKANLSIYLTETDGDRWKMSPDLTGIDQGKWKHFEYNLKQMELWGLGNNTANWDSIGGITVEPSGTGGEIVFYIDNLRLSGGSGYVDLLDPANIPALYPSSPPTTGKLNTTNPAGHAFIAGHGNFWTSENSAYSLEKMCGLSESVAISSAGYIGSTKTALLSGRMTEINRPLMEEHADAADFAVELTRAQAWCVRWDGESNNITPGKFDQMHSACFSHPKFIELNKRRVDALIAGGINTLTYVDFVWPYYGGRWGYSEHDIKAYREALTERDGGLTIVEKSGKKTISFWDYFRDYVGYIPRPEDVGCSNWAEYTPSNEREAWVAGGAKLKNIHLFVVLMHWEYIKFLQTIGQYIETKGGHLWIIPNPEDLGNAADYVYLSRLDGLQGILPEFFGNPLWTDAIYRSGGYLARNSHESGHYLGPQLEINAGGHGTPYYDPQISYAVTYDLCASLSADVIKNDFMDESAYDFTSNPQNKQQYDRFRDTMSKVYAFDQYKLDRPARTASNIAVFTPRNIDRFRADLFYTFIATEKTNDGCMAEALAKDGIIFDLMDPIRFADLEKYELIFWGVPETSDVTIDRIKKWLSKGSDRVFICHSNQLTRRNTGTAYVPWLMNQNKIEYPFGGNKLGLPAISKFTKNTANIIDLVGKPLLKTFKKGETLKLPETLYTAEGGNVLLSCGEIPVVSEFKLENGARVIYLHYKAGEPESLELDRKIGAALADYYTKAERTSEPNNQTIIHTYQTGGGSVSVIWANQYLRDWKFVYDGNRSQRLNYQLPGFETKVRIPVKRPGKYLVYEVFSKTEKVVDAAKYVDVEMRNASCAVYYVLPYSEESRKILNKLKSNPIYGLQGQ